MRENKPVETTRSGSGCCGRLRFIPSDNCNIDLLHQVPYVNDKYKSLEIIDSDT